LYDYVFSGLLTHLPICYGFIDYRPGAHATIFLVGGGWLWLPAAGCALHTAHSTAQLCALRLPAGPLAPQWPGGGTGPLALALGLVARPS
jgi:hypothetical protein